MVLVTTCIEGIFDFSKIEDGIYFLRQKKIAVSTSNFVHKIVNNSNWNHFFKLLSTELDP